MGSDFIRGAVKYAVRLRFPLAGLFVWAALATVAPATPPPNIVLIVIDDVGYGDLGCYGSKVHATPHIDALAAGGLQLTDFHSNGAVCSPTRAALLTGRYQQRCGIESAIGFVGDHGMPLVEQTLAELLAPAGYVSGVFGKWHLGHVDTFGPNDQGFDVSWCSNNSPDYHTHISRVGKPDWFHNHKPVQEPGYLTDLVTRHTVQFLRDHRQQPFFAYVSHLAVHFPFQGPHDPPLRTAGKIWHDKKFGPLPESQYRRAYKDMLEAVDGSVAEIVATLEELGLRQNTLVVVTSDNGAYSWVGNNEPFRGQKGDLFEGGHRVPAIFYWPGRIAAGSGDQATMTMDLVPTLLAIAGIEPPDDLLLDGVDLGPLLFRGESLENRTLYWRFNNDDTGKNAYAVRSGDYKYIVQDGQPLLFNLRDDPRESRNLIVAQAERAAQLDKAYRRWIAAVTTKGADR
jgi:arylsulfatase A-like enzyme